MTLIELLAAIMIVAILLGMLAPMVASTREGARQTECLANLRQLSMAALMYADDHDGRLPLPVTVSAFAPGFTAFPERQLYPYVGDWRVYRCPSSRAGEMIPNPLGAGGYSYWSGTMGRSLASRSRPAETPLFGDGIPRHNGGTDWCFLDGHVKWLKAQTQTGM